jgi:dipeptidyl aminopeptidase/acylaminoacyl peptidase
VPVDQTEEIVRKLVEGGIPHEYHRFEGEGHGWRKSETLADYYRNIEAFLNQHLFPINR